MDSQQPFLIGDYPLILDQFQNLETALQKFKAREFQELSLRKRFRFVNETLLKLIQEMPEQSFLLAAVIKFIQEVNDLKCMDEYYHFTSFEFFLNHFSNLSEEDNYRVRAKIMGRYIPRDQYQAFYPIGMGKTFNGSHFVAAHLSPDIDTTIASFWGWVDAFSARIGTGIHYWNLPGGPPDSPVIQYFKDIFGQTVFSHLARTTSSLTLTAMDLVTQKNLIKESASTLISTLDHGYHEKAVILVDESGHYCGDWRSVDVEIVRQIIVLFKSCLRWFETNLQAQLIAFFSKNLPHIDDLQALLKAVFDVKIMNAEPVQEFSERQIQLLDGFFKEVVEMPSGLEGTYADLNKALDQLSFHKLAKFQEEVESLRISDLFDNRGLLIEDRPRIFHRIQKIIENLDQTIYEMRDFAERLDVVLKIKTKVLNRSLHYLTLRSDIEDVKLKMQHYDYLTVVIPDHVKGLFPIGVVWAKDLRQPYLGTVAFRDFCNEDEVKMAGYLSVISVIDHHKSTLKTNSTPLALISDTQSCNVLIAEQSLQINRCFSSARMSLSSIEDQIKEINTGNYQPQEKNRLLQRLLQRRNVVEQRDGYYVHPQREMVEYICFLQAILDDTDLLTKVSNRDVVCVAALLNQLKTLSEQKEVEAVDLNEIPLDKNFAKIAAKKLLQNTYLYTIYRHVYAFKEKEINEQLQSCNAKRCDIFADTKEQNGCCRIGQTKLFCVNIPLYKKLSPMIRSYWLANAIEITRNHPEIDLHLHMISTIASADEVYNDAFGNYTHKDELWFWIPSTEQARNHLANFLNAFQSAQEIKNKPLDLQLLGSQTDDLETVFRQNFLPLPIEKNNATEIKIPFAILYYEAGTINSRKAAISPYLPKLR